METFNLLDNQLIKDIDSISTERNIDLPMSNTLKTLVKANEIVNFTSGEIYNKKRSILIPKEFDNLSQLYMKITASTDSVACTVESYFATKVFKYVRIKTKNGLVLQTFTPRYSQSRIDQVYDSPIYPYYALAVEPDITFLSGNPTCFLPLFSFFSESVSTMLATRPYEQLEVEFITNDTKESMGLSIDLTSLSIELHCLYHDVNTSSRYDDQLLVSKPNVPNIKGSYTIFEEDTEVISSGSTSARLLLRCPHPLFSLNMALVAADSSRKQIKTMKLSFADRTFVDLDYRINFQNYGDNKSFLETGTLSYFFSRLKERSVDSGLITFTDDMAPVYLDITFDSLGVDHSLYVWEEYRTKFSVSETGIIGLSNDVVGFREGLKQLNSSTAGSNLTG